MKLHYVTFSLLLFATDLGAQTVNITNNYTSRVNVVITGSNITGSGRTEKLIPSIPKAASIRVGKSRKLHVDVINNISFRNLADPRTGTKPYTLSFMYPQYVGAHRAVKDAEINYVVTPEGKVEQDKKGKEKKAEENKK